MKRFVEIPGETDVLITICLISLLWKTDYHLDIWSAET